MPRDDDFPDAGEDLDYFADQPIAERREIQRGLRSLIDQTNEYQDEFLEANPQRVEDIMKESEEWINRTKQPGEATIDATLLLKVTELSYKRTLRWTSGNVGNGVDVDEFVSKCITYMRQGRGIGDDDAPQLSSTQRHRRVMNNRGAMGNDDDDEMGDDGDMLNWAHLGEFACIPHVRRPATAGFLLGPLSVEKKVRRVTQRTERLRINNLKEVRPQVLRVEDMDKTEKSSLTAQCGKILRQLGAAEAALEEEYKAKSEVLEEDEVNQLMYRRGLRSDGGIDLLRFVVNPHSFGQTVENMFYVSFLIRDGRAGLSFDEDDMPSLFTHSADEADGAASRAKRGAMKHQAILSMDMATWRDIIKTYDIKEPMIEHREETENRGPGARGWYS